MHNPLPGIHSPRPPKKPDALATTKRDLETARQRCEQLEGQVSGLTACIRDSDIVDTQRVTEINRLFSVNADLQTRLTEAERRLPLVQELIDASRIMSLTSEVNSFFPDARARVKNALSALSSLPSPIAAEATAEGGVG